MSLPIPPASARERPSAPRLFLVDGYALIYRAFFALLSRPLTTRHGENTSAAWGIANFLDRLRATHTPEYLGWVHDSGMSFRHERYPAYKATRQKLTEELQSDFDRGMERIAELLNAHHIPVLSLSGFEADDVIGTLVSRAVEQKLNVVVVSGDKDFQQLVQPGVWLLNPGRGGSAGVDEHWVNVDNASDRLGVAPDRVTDYLALVGDASDNIPGVKGVGEKTARILVSRYANLEAILDAAPLIEQKRPREALMAHADAARLSKELVTIRTDLPVSLDLHALAVRLPDYARLRQIFVDLEFHTLVKGISSLSIDDAAKEETPRTLPGGAKEDIPTSYETIRNIEEMHAAVMCVRHQGRASIETITASSAVGIKVPPHLKSTLVGIAIGTVPGHAFYFPLAHRSYSPPQTGLPFTDLATAPLPADMTGDPSALSVYSIDGAGEVRAEVTRRPRKKTGTPESIAAQLLAEPQEPIENLPSILSDEMLPLRAILEDAAIGKTAHNAKQHIVILRKIGVNLRGLEFDTMLASYVLDPQRRSHELDVLASECLGKTMTSQEDLRGRGRNVIALAHVPTEAAGNYACQGADMALRMRPVLEAALGEQVLAGLLRDVELPLVAVLADMEWIGIAIDQQWFASLKERFMSERERVEHAIYVSAGEVFNINSNAQLRDILFGKLQFPVRKKTATGPSTDASVLTDLAEEGHVLPSLLLEYRELTKLESTYLDTLPTLVDPVDGRLHTSFNQTVAATGRLSSSDPNLQNIPIRRELGKDIRRGFIPRATWCLMSADYSQIELRLLAHLSGDAAFVAAFQSGGDIHRETAARIFDVTPDAVTAAMRSRAKTINFATIYGQSAHALARQLHIEFDEAKEFIARYFERFQGVRTFLDSQIDLARSQGYVQTISGRRRYIPEIRDRNFNVRAFGERTAANSPIQGSAADLIKIAMIRIAAKLIGQRREAKMLLQVHDELLFELPRHEVDSVSEIIRFEMEHAIDLSVPLVVDIGIGDNWLSAKAI